MTANLVQQVRETLATNYRTLTGVDLDGFASLRNEPGLQGVIADAQRTVDRLGALLARMPERGEVDYVTPEFRAAFAQVDEYVRDLIARADIMGDRNGVPTR